ncbi:MAG: hypothetical protein GY913_26515 [Proteobacteria bacterium]|nr:hypothetical protein [Pseudomonadota bacterium]MCP4920471.1 hypothetical protein [Pseudomonadota bacterium]
MTALLLGAAMAASTQSDTKSGIHVEATYAWPERLDRGYFPVQVVVENTSQEDRQIELTFTETYGYQSNTERVLELEPGERREFEVVLPSFMPHVAGHSMSVTDEGRWLTTLSPLGPSELGTDYRGSVLLASKTAYDFEEEHTWRDRLSLSDVNATGTAAFDHLPRDPGAYTSLGLVIVDVTEGMPSADQLEGLAGWVRLGGAVVLVGDTADVHSAPVFAEWMEDRFAWEPWLDAGLLPGINTWAMGMGQLSVASPEEAAQPLTIQSIVQPSFRSEISQRLPRGTYQTGGAAPEIPGVEQLPRGAYALLMFCVAMVLGPLNAFAVKLLKRPSMMLVTTPVLAVGSTLLMVGYGLSHNGLGVQTAGYSITMLDQRNHTAATHAVRQIFFGLSPGKGLRPEPGTWHFPISPDWDFRYESSWDGGRVVSGDLVPIRAPIRQVLISEGTRRERLEFTGGQASNTLGAEIEQLVVRSGGAWYVLDEPLATGAATSLTVTEDIDAALESLWQSDTATRQSAVWPHEALDFPDGSYIARLGTSLFIDDEGVDPREVVGEHWVIGVLEGT